MKRLYLLFLLLSLMSTAAFAQRVALRTDLLLWGTTTPNAGVETSISRHFTMALNGAYNARKFGNDMKLNLYLIQPELRYWPCRKFEGHFTGVHGHYAYYNVGQIPFLFGYGRHYLPGRPVWRRYHLRLSLGAGRPLLDRSRNWRRICPHGI